MICSPGRRRRAVLFAVALVSVLLVGCGLEGNSDPRAIAVDDIPPGLIDEATSTTTTIVGAPTTASVTVYYLAIEQDVTLLTAVTREVVDPGRPQDRLEALLTPPTPEEQQAGITTSIPAGTMLLDTELDDASSELTIDLSTSLFDVQGEELRNAFAQLVWTITELEDVDHVRFLVDGEQIRVPDEAGIEQPGAVQRADYLTLRPAA
ncbi:MAG: GerMN domain-containing protein [Acidimicrobiales bacterium]|nr:GerMN domain-containing protein [Acidimicrobiales bacterium]